MSKARATCDVEIDVAEMREHSLEIYVVPMAREITCFVSSPKYGKPAPLAPYAKKTCVLNDGANRVFVGVYNHEIDIERIKHIAREAISRW